MEIILYESRQNQKLHPRTSIWLKKTGLFLQLISTVIIVLVFLSLAFIFFPLWAKEITYRLKAFRPTPFLSVNQISPKPAPSKDETAQEAANYGVGTDFSLVIPKIAAAAQILPNINPADEKSYREALSRGVAHAAGTRFPGQKGTIYLFAHSASSPTDISRYNAVFYLLKELRKNDEIILFFAGQKYTYQVTDYFITAAKDTQWLTKETNEETLILQTCWPPGTSQKRLLVIAKRTN